MGSWAYLTYPCQSLVENYIQPLYLDRCLAAQHPTLARSSMPSRLWSQAIIFTLTNVLQKSQPVKAPEHPTATLLGLSIPHILLDGFVNHWSLTQPHVQPRLWASAAQCWALQEMFLKASALSSDKRLCAAVFRVWACGRQVTATPPARLKTHNFWPRFL